MTDNDIIRRDMPACLKAFAELAARVEDEPTRVKLRELYREARGNPYPETRLVALTIASYILTANDLPCAARLYRVGNSEGKRPGVSLVVATPNQPRGVE